MKINILIFFVIPFIVGTNIYIYFFCKLISILTVLIIIAVLNNSNSVHKQENIFKRRKLKSCYFKNLNHKVLGKCVIKVITFKLADGTSSVNWFMFFRYY